MYVGLNPPLHAGFFEWSAHAQLLKENPWFFAFAVVMAIDLFTGTTKCWYKNSKTKASSTVGRKGLVTHFTIFVVWVVVYPLLDSWGLADFENVGLLFFIYQYILSSIENLGEMGVKIPPYFMSRLDKLSDIYEEKYGSEDKNKEDQ